MCSRNPAGMHSKERVCGMRILIATDWYKPVINGVVTSVVNLENTLREQGHDVRVLTLSPNVHAREDEHVYYLRSLSINKIYPNARIIYSNARKYLKEIIAWKPEIIHTQCEFSSFFMAKRIARRLDIPIVHTYHTVYEDYTHYFAPTVGMGRNIASKISRLISNRVERFIVPTEKVKKLLRGYHIEKPIDVIPTGINLLRFQMQYAEEEIQREKQRLGIPLTNTLCVSLGRLAKEKNETELIRYFEKMDLPNCTYLIVGDGPYRETLEKQVREAGLEERVIFCGMVQPEQVPLYYQMGDIFICASSSEAQGITYIEAMASGIPVLCRYDACLESVITNGVNGCCYEDYEQFEDAFRKIITDRKYAGQLAENAKVKVNEYSLETFALRVMNTYKAAILGGGAGEFGSRLNKKVV